MPQWDDIVVGAGLFGSSLARRLTEAGRHVLVVSGGRTVSTPPRSHIRNTDSFRQEPDSYFPGIDQYFDYLDVEADAAALPGAYPSSIAGGDGVLWTNNCPRAVDGVDRPDLLSSNEWDNCFSVAEDHLEVRTDEFDDSFRLTAVGQRLQPSLAAQGRAHFRLPLSGRREGPDRIHYLGPADVLADTDDAEFVPGTVEVIDHDGQRARGVQLGGVEHSAQNIILAAGAVDTPHLLWRSGIRPEALGRYLSYHPVLIGQVVLEDGLWDTGEDTDPLPRIAIAPTPDRPWFVMVLRDTNPLPPEPPDLEVPANRLIEIQVFSPVDPHPDNRMTFTDGRVAFDVPLGEADEARRVAIERDAHEIGATIGRFRAGCEPAWAPLGTPHLMGSCRMGETDDGTSVTDRFGRVWGMENLYLATNGLIPTALAVNPTLTGVALAVHTADHIIGQA